MSYRVNRKTNTFKYLATMLKTILPSIHAQ